MKFRRRRTWGEGGKDGACLGDSERRGTFWIDGSLKFIGCQHKTASYATMLSITARRGCPVAGDSSLCRPSVKTRHTRVALCSVLVLAYLVVQMTTLWTYF